MSNESHFAQQKTNEIPSELAELADAIRQLPSLHRQRVEQALGRVLASTKRRHRILTLVQDALSQLRLDMKYLMFDLDATRRERDDYRQKLEEAS